MEWKKQIPLQMHREILQILAEEGGDYTTIARTKYKVKHDPVQDFCTYGYVLPDRCRYSNLLGCHCGAYPGDRK